MPTRSARPSRVLLQRTVAESRALLRGHDLALLSAGAALFGGLCIVPSLLVAVSLAQLLIGRGRLHQYGYQLAGALPSAIGADSAARAVLDAGLRLGPVGVAFAVVMGSAYGDGLSRAFARLAPVLPGSRPPTVLLRLATLPVLGLAPLSLGGLLLAGPWLAHTASSWAGVALASYVSLNLIWVLTWLPLTWTFRVVGPGRPSWRVAFAGAVVTGAFVSGFLQGFLVFCALPIDLARPFGGLLGVGAAAALTLWLWVLHGVVLVGYTFTWGLQLVLDERRRNAEGSHTATPAELSAPAATAAGH